MFRRERELKGGSGCYALSTASSSYTPTNAALMETMIICHACKIASAKRITAVVSLQSHKTPSRVPGLTYSGAAPGDPFFRSAAAFPLCAPGQEGQVSGADNCKACGQYARQQRCGPCHCASTFASQNPPRRSRPKGNLRERLCQRENAPMLSCGSPRCRRWTSTHRRSKASLTFRSTSEPSILRLSLL